MIEDFYLSANAVMNRLAPATDLARYARLEYGSSETAWLVRSVPPRKAGVTPVARRSPWGARVRAVASRIAEVLFPANPPGRARVSRSRDLLRAGVAEDALGAATFLAAPRRRLGIDTSELGRYARLEFGDADPSWIVLSPAEEERFHEKALERWLRGDDRALGEWLEEPHPVLVRKAEAPATA